MPPQRPELSSRATPTYPPTHSPSPGSCSCSLKSPRRSLVKGSIIACVGIVLVVFFVAFCGLLAAWAGLITPTLDFNLYFMAVRASACRHVCLHACSPARLPAWSRIGLCSLRRRATAGTPPDPVYLLNGLLHAPLSSGLLQALGAVNESNNISKWIGVVVMLLAVVMNMSAVDSLQVHPSPANPCWELSQKGWALCQSHNCTTTAPRPQPRETY